MSDIAAYEKVRAQKTLSLSLAKRKAEREAADADQLRRENERRKAQGKPVFASLAEMETLRAGSEQSGEGNQPVPAGAKVTPVPAAEKEPDILLDSTTQVMGDIVAGIAPAAAPRTVAQRESKPEAAGTN